jgi:hypothetical protein
MRAGISRPYIWTTDQVAAAAIESEDIADAAVTAAKLAANAVETTKIKDLAVTEGKIADLAVSAAKLAADAVETDKIKTGAVTEGKIAGQAVTYAKIGQNAVDSIHLYYTIKQSRAKAYRSTTQSYTHETFTKVQFNTEVFDPYNDYDNATNFRYTVHSGFAGQYVVHAKARISSTATAAAKLIEVWVNNMLVSKGLFHSTGVTGDFDGEIMAVLNLSAGDYVEIFIYDPSDGTILAGSDQTYFEIFRLP